MLKEKTIKALAWQTGAKFVTQLFSITVTIVLARKLLPADYGLVGMAIIFTGLLSLINEFGIGSSIVSNKNITDEELSSVFWFALFMGVGMCVLSNIAAPSIADFFNNQSITKIIRVLSFCFILGALQTVPLSLLDKELQFGKHSVAEMVSNLSGGIVAIALAYTGWGVWSLVLSALVQSFILTLVVFHFSPWRPSLSYSFSKVRHIVGFGGKIVLTRIQWYCYSNADYFIIGRLLGDNLLGHYTMAFRLATLPTEKITAIVNQVMFPAFAKLQSNKELQREAFLKCCKYISMLTFPMLVSIFILANEITIIVLTEKWLPIVFPFRVLCLMGMIKSVDATIPQLLVANGKANQLLKYTTVLLLTLPAAFLIGCLYNGIDGVAYAWLFAYPVLVSYLFYIGLKEIQLSFGGYLKNIMPQLVGTGVMGTIIYYVKLSLAFYVDLNSLLMLALICLAGFVSYVGYYFIFCKGDLQELIKAIMEMKKKRMIPKPT